MNTITSIRAARMMVREEIHWMQKSRVSWLLEGDRNTAFFHASTIQRRAASRIWRLKINDAWNDSAEDIKHHIIDHFSSLYTATHTYDVSSIMADVISCVDDVTNVSLCAIPGADDIKKIVFSIHPTKSPGPDGMTGKFYRAHWDILGNDLIAAVQHFFNTGYILQQMNQNFRKKTGEDLFPTY